jgi:hypothetical protein|tara:strand:- start:2101 stop:2463 length:363 start_codon:yes stop_codon:yes gene_type:complete
MSEIKPPSPIDMFFKLGDKVTGGDPLRKMDFDYYLMWIMFLAFVFIAGGNLRTFFIGGYHYQNFGWFMFGTAICWFQYWSLMNIYKIRKMQKEVTIENVHEDDDDEVESPEDMIKSFKKK